jgi:uncharacterized protein (DUF1501 family)
MHRRDFLKSGLGGAVLAGGSLGIGWPFSCAWGAAPASVPRTLVNVMLVGGADFRFAFVPTPGYSAVYVEKFWNARNSLYTQGYPDYATMYAAEYQTVNDPVSGLSFGVHNSCGWLAQQFNAGNVAIISNIHNAVDRAHDHAQLIVNTGDLTASPTDTNRDGWGGRLVEAAGSGYNVTVISEDVSVFSMGVNAGNRLEKVIHARDMRKMALPVVDPSRSAAHSINVMIRALGAYYKERGVETRSEKPGNWPYHRFFQHDNSLREFGSAVKSRLAGYPLPSPLNALSLNNPRFAAQCRNLYDCCLTPDILQHRVISMNYIGWDTHSGQQTVLNKNLQDIFGSGGGLDTVTSQLASDVPGANDNLVYTFGTDFGRQLATNGGRGTDHGHGNYSVLIGNALNGGVYGDMFPEREALPDPGDSLGRAPFEIPGMDIRGLTSFERVMARMCDWVAPGTGSVVFPNASGGIVEPGLTIDDLLST